MATYRIKAPDGSTYRINAPEDASESDVLAYAQQQFAQPAAPRGIDTTSPEFQLKLAAQRARDEAEYDPLKGTSWGERAALNLGAGLDTTWQGAKQLAGKVGLGTGMSDEELRDKRALDKRLAEATRGGGALQVVGEAAPTLVLGLGGGAALSRLAPGAARLLATTPGVIAAGGAGGAASGALQPVTDDESRAVNALVGGTVGAVVPGAAKGIGAAWAMRPTVKAAEARATEAARKALPTTEPELLDTLRAASEQADMRGGSQVVNVRGKPREIPASAAQLADDPRLMQLEAASRARPATQPAWSAFDAERNAALYDTVQAMAPSELRLERLARARDLATGPTRERALAEAAQRGNVADPVLAHAKNVLEGDTGANPAVESVAKYVQRALGDNASPGRVYEVRKVLADKLGGRPAIGDELGAAVKGAQRETSAMIDAIDNALAGGAREGSSWGQYLGDYTARSAPITSGRALRTAADELADKPLRGTTPEVTAAGYQRAIDKASSSKRFGDKLTPEARSEADAFLARLKEAESASRTRKLAGTAGGGSQTAMDMALAAGTHGANAILPGAGMAMSAVKGMGALSNDRVQQQVAQLLQNPKALADVLAGVPAAERQQFVRNLMLIGSGQVAGAALTP